jgi:serine/threonine-protein kinase
MPKLTHTWNWKRITSTSLLTAGVLLSLFVLLDKLLLPALVFTYDEVRVPNVTGLDITTARQQLADMDLEVVEPREQFSATVRKGVVMSQLPAAGATVKEGRRIYLAVSKGEETITMPELRGMTLRDARMYLLRRGLNIGNVSYDFNDSVQAHRILSQAYAPGSQVPYGELVDVTVCKGADGVRVPDLVGFSFDEARALLEGLGLATGTIMTEENSVFDANTVIRQRPPADSLLPSGSTVDLTVSR